MRHVIELDPPDIMQLFGDGFSLPGGEAVILRANLENAAIIDIFRKYRPADSEPSDRTLPPPAEMSPTPGIHEYTPPELPPAARDPLKPLNGEATEKKKRRYGTGSISRSGRNWQIRYNKDGRQIFQTSKSESYEDAEKLLDQRIAERDKEIAVKSETPAPVRKHDNNGTTSKVPLSILPGASQRPPEKTNPRDGDPKCSRGSCVHTKSQHIGANGKCIACWCYGFVGREQFATT